MYNRKENEDLLVLFCMKDGKWRRDLARLSMVPLRLFFRDIHLVRRKEEKRRRTRVRRPSSFSFRNQTSPLAHHHYRRTGTRCALLFFPLSFHMYKEGREKERGYRSNKKTKSDRTEIEMIDARAREKLFRSF